MTDTVGVQEIPEEIRRDIEEHANVVGEGIGLERTDEEGLTDRTAVVVFVEKKLEKSELHEEDVLPESIEIDGEELPVDVQEVGVIEALAVAGLSSEPEQALAINEVVPLEMDDDIAPRAAVEGFGRVKKMRPAPAGVSIGHSTVTAGTLGSSPLRNRHGKTVFLTNNHVAAASGDASVGDPILQPGRFDGGTLPDDRIGTLLEFSTITFGSNSRNTSDSALVEIAPDHVQTDLFELQEDIRGWEEAAVGQVYTKTGRTTGVTRGRCTARNVNAAVNFGSKGVANFVGLDVFEYMSAGGDSGSLIGIERPEGFYGTSLLFAGSSQITLGIPMSAVQQVHGRLTPLTAQDLVDAEDLRIAGHIASGSLAANETRYQWFGPWDPKYEVAFTVHPTSNGGYIRGTVDSLYRNQYGTYYLVKMENRQNAAANYDVRYVVRR
ncbi:chymotrypsin family serine protease [Halalkalicoccus salilacus]|uniref:hypothetical protein n=1 Tax=Halalkalicoccus salilacus TaxID=3117459 RepID=UPI00300F58D6